LTEKAVSDQPESRNGAQCITGNALPPAAAMAVWLDAASDASSPVLVRRQIATKG
jgi:hypothetical protein